MSENTDHSYLGNDQTQNNIPAKVYDHKYNQPAKNNICQNLTENVQDEQTNNTQNHEAIVMLATGTFASIIGKKETKFNSYKHNIKYQSQQPSKLNSAKLMLFFSIFS